MTDYAAYSDEDLLRRWQQHRVAEALDTLFDRHNAQFACFVAQHLGNLADPEDEVQKLWCKVVRWSSVPDNFKAFASTILQNQITDAYRKKKTVSLDNMASSTGEDIAHFEPEVSAPSPIQNAILNESIKQLRQCISALDPMRQAIFKMRYIDEMKLEQISKRTGVSIATVHKYAKEAHKMIRHAMNCLEAPGGQHRDQE